MPIRQLTPAEINRIAAGEVIERPASAVKELVENAIDAGAREVEVVAADGGLSLIRVTDDGCGMSAADLALCIERHATSKLNGGDLSDIRSLGFRGEALPSIGAAGRLAITSRTRLDTHGHTVSVEGSVVSPLRPAAHPPGTRVEVRDLFYATPARLKFMKSERAENAAIADVVKRLALAFPATSFTCVTGERVSLSLPRVPDGDESALRQRLARIMGRDFAQQAEAVSLSRDDVRIAGFAGLPVLNRPDPSLQSLFVNGRPVKDRLLLSAIRAAYGDLVPKGRHPLAALFLHLPADTVDVNVHPAKTEVRFRDAALIRALVISALREALGRAPAAAVHLTRAALPAFRSPGLAGLAWHKAALPLAAPGEGFREAAQAPIRSESAQQPEPPADDGQYQLGLAKAQVHRAYIVAETEHGLLLVDQHAAHERLVYEKLKASLAAGAVARQGLLIPEIVELGEEDLAAILDHAADLDRLGLAVEPFGPGAIAVRETPALFGQGDIRALIIDLAGKFRDGRMDALEARLHAICATIACHGSVRSGREMRLEEMNALLRQMEATPGAAQCNHGRPTFIELPLPEIEKLFQRR